MKLLIKVIEKVIKTLQRSYCVVQQQNITSICLQNLELFEFMRVFALPKISNIGPMSTISVFDVRHKKSTIRFEFSFLPDPDTPVINMNWDFLTSLRFLRTSFAKS